MVETELKYIKNIGLFSKHYLQNILPKREIWKETDRAKPVFDKIKSLYNANRVFLSSSPNEAQLRDKFLNNVLEKLDHYYQVEGKVEKSAKHPDYGLFADKESSQEAIALQGKDDFYKKAIAICEAKSWEISLDKSVKGKPTFANQNPSFQVDAYLRETAPQWAILTNGRYWRLYYQETSYRLVNYFEIDLGEIIDKDCLEEFKYFYLLFRREAFIPDSQGVCFLDHVYNGSIAYAKELGENVQENVYKAMKTLAEGFISWTENKLSLTNDEKVNDEILREVQENTMKLLYRLLFIFYAEAGGLLDIENRSYRDSYSLDSLKRIIRDRITGGHTISRYTSNHWNKLQDLFRLIDNGLKIPEEKLFIPAYNGGLFDPKRNRFLKEKRVGDYFVAKAIDLLATSKGKNDSEKGFVDYSSLDIRHLGAIYEGLLEYKMKRSEEPMVAIRKGKKELWIPELEFKGKKYVERVDEGGLYLATDKGERKATGSYYTPDYIVKYIVKNTVGPIVEEKIKQAEKEGKSICDAILSIKVLDPAMGSGHFLVEVVDFLTQPHLDAVSKDIERGIIGEKEVTAEWAKREIAAHCIYGADLNPMAVELAKVSLWLKTIAKDKPLSFLDHRLKLGNSLIGANLSELRNYPDLKKKKKEIDKDQQQFEVVIPQIFIDRLLKKTREIDSIRDETLEDTKRKEEIFAKLKKTDAYIKTLAIANVNTAVYFGNEVGATSTKDKKGVYYQLINTLDFPKDWQWLSKKDWFIKAQKIAEGKRFFHWELEFPEVFFEKGKRKDNPGFDAVIGNPPYVMNSADMQRVKTYLEDAYSEIFHGQNDICYYFIARAIDLMRNEGRFSYIIARYFIEAKNAFRLRKYILNNCSIEQILDFRNNQVFGRAVNVLTILFQMVKRRHKEETRIVTINDGQEAILDKILSSPLMYTGGEGVSVINLSREQLTDKPWHFQSVKDILPFESDNKLFPPLGDLDFLSICKGMETGLNSIVDIDGTEKGVLMLSEEEVRNNHIERKVLRKVIKGQDIERFSINYRNRYIIYLKPSDDINVYLNTKRYLSQFREKLENRWDFKKGNCTWFSMGNLRNQQVFDMKTERIFVPTYSKKHVFGYDSCKKEEFFYGMTDTYIISKTSKHELELKYILALLNSKCIQFFHRRHAKLKRAGYYEYIENILKRFPIRRISFVTSKNVRKRLVRKLRETYEKTRFVESLATVNEHLPKDKEGNFITKKEKSDVVHDILAFLAEQMIEMNKEKNEEIKGFLDWIERQIGVHIEDLSLKTYLKEYDEHDFNDLLRVMRQNKNKIQLNTDSREFQETLKKEFDASMTKLKPLKEKIEKTDWLIDQIVYKLYGLTDEEIGMVEEKLGYG